MLLRDDFDMAMSPEVQWYKNQYQTTHLHDDELCHGTTNT